MDPTTATTSPRRSTLQPRTVPIGDYGFLSDGQTTALVAPNGSVDWMCLPRMDSPSVFGALLGRHAGGFRVGPADDVSVPVARRYLPGTMVIETSWATSTGWLVVRDALIIGPWRHEDDFSPVHHRAPTDYEAAHVLVRTLHCVKGEVQAVVECEPVPGYGEAPVRWTYTDRVYHQARAQTDGAEAPLALTTDLRLGLGGGKASARTLLHEGDVHYVALSWGPATPPLTHADAENCIEFTAHHWQRWLSRGRFPDHPWRHHLQRSALALKGLMYAPTGAICAAATTSLPETPGGGRNYDYRFTWVRDSTFALWGLYSLGFDWEAVDFFSFIADIADRDDDLQIMYGIGGERDLPERELDHLPGYAHSRPVRVGNAASTQHQHDVWGALLDSVYLHSQQASHMDPRLWSILAKQVQAALAQWREPDAGIWEVRGGPKHFTSSKIMCWVALDRASRLAGAMGRPGEADDWAKAADEIKADILAHGVDSRGVFTQYYGSDALDASLLLAPLVRFLPPDDPRIVATVNAIADELTEHGMVLRYRTGQTDDGFSGKEGSFTICSFWLVSALCEIGEYSRARRLCAKLLSFAGDLGLYAEEIDPESGAHLGNFPQAFTHLALINAVMHVIRTEELADGTPTPTAREG